MREAKPDPKPVRQPRKPYRRKVASRLTWERLRDEKLFGGCRVCDRTFSRYDLTLHHVVSRGQGGDDVADNLVPLCGTGTTGCHGLVEARDRKACAALRLSLTDAEYSYAVGKLGEDGLDRRYPVEYEATT